MTWGSTGWQTRNLSDILLIWILKSLAQWCLIVYEVEVPELLWHGSEEGVRGPKKKKTLEWIYYLRLENPSLDSVPWGDHSLPWAYKKHTSEGHAGVSEIHSEGYSLWLGVTVWGVTWNWALLVSFWMMELQNGGGQVMALNQERPGEWKQL